MMRILWIRIRVRNTDYNGVRLSQELSRVPSSAISKKLKEALKHIAMETKTGFSLFEQGVRRNLINSILVYIYLFQVVDNVNVWGYIVYLAVSPSPATLQWPIVISRIISAITPASGSCVDSVKQTSSKLTKRSCIFTKRNETEWKLID